tara:strand:- start:1900 stop:5625 length:3726 start_codon:yes stop_codon:yes gene_type:complete
MKRPISPFQLGELALVGFDAVTAGVGGTIGAKTLYKWLTKTVNKTPEEAFTIMKNNPELADDAMVGKSIDELTDEEYEKLSIGAAVPPKKKTVSPETKENEFFGEYYLNQDPDYMTPPKDPMGEKRLLPSNVLPSRVALTDSMAGKSKSSINTAQQLLKELGTDVDTVAINAAQKGNLRAADIAGSGKVKKVKKVRHDGNAMLYKKSTKKGSLEPLAESTIAKKVFKKEKLIKGHALEQSAAKVLGNEMTLPQDFSIYEMIPEELMMRVKSSKNLEGMDPTKPQIFSTHARNMKHKSLGAGIIRNLIKKYKVLGYEFIPNKKELGGEWVFNEELLLPLSQRKEVLSKIKKNIDDLEGELKDLKLETMFYDPSKDRMVFFGKGPESLTDLKKDIKAKGYAYGGSVEPGQFTDPMMSIDEEDIDIKDFNMAPAYEGIEDLDIFEEAKKQGYEEVEVANLMVPFFKMFGKAPPNVIAPIPTPKPNLANQTKKQAESLAAQQEKSAMEDVFDPTPESKIRDEITTETDLAAIQTTPLTNQPLTSVFYSDIERALAKADAPKQFASKEEVFDYFSKNNIKRSEEVDYRIPQILRLFPEGEPIPTSALLAQIRQAPIKGLRVHATGYGSETINPQGKVNLAYSGYKEPGHITDTARERVLILPKKSIAGDTGELPLTFRGEGQAGQRHRFGESDDMYVIGWSRLTDRYGKIPQKVEGPQTKINVKKLKKDLTKNNNTLNGLYAEAESKIQQLAGRRGFNQADIEEIMEDFGTPTFKASVIAKYADQIDEISPGLVDQMDELVVKNRDLTDQISKAETPSAEGVVRVTFADEIQSDLMQEAAKRKKFLAGTLRRMQDQGKSIDDLSDYDELNKQVMQFYKENESIFRPETKTAAEVDIMRQQLTKMDEEVDSIVNKYIATREISDKDLTRLGEMLQTNLDNLLNKVMTIDSNTMGKLFPNLPFKNRNEWADAVIKKDLYEAAYRKFVLKDPNAADYYAVTPDTYVNKRWDFEGDTSTPQAVRNNDKKEILDHFQETGNLKDSKYKGIGTSEFYGGPNAKAPVRYSVIDKNQPIKQPLRDASGEVVKKDGKTVMETTGYKKVKDFKGSEDINEALNYADVSNQGMDVKYDVVKEQPHYTSVLEKILATQARQNNSEFITLPVQLREGSMNVFKITDQNGNMVATLSDKDQALRLKNDNPNYQIQPLSVPDEGAMEPVFAIKITKEMLEPYVTHKAQGGLVEDIDIFEVA